MPVTINGTTGIAGVDGSNTTPAIKGGTSTGTGVFYGTNTVSLATGGTTAVTVDSNQNVGIGTTSPVTYGASSKTITLAAPSFPSIGMSATSSSTGNKNYRWIARDDANGGPIIQFQTTDDSWGSEQNVWYVSRSTTGISYQSWYSGAAGSNAERMRLDSSGNFNLGTATTVAGARLNVASSSNLLQFGGGVGPSSAFTAYLYCGSNGLAIQTATTGGIGAIQFYNPNGTVGSIVTNGSATAFNTSSDYRLKENVLPMSGALAKVAQLKPVTYTWKADGSDGQGFIAHELQAVVPDCVTGEKDAVDADGKPVYQGVDTSFLVATLTAAIQELSAKLDAAEARIAALEAK